MRCVVTWLKWIFGFYRTSGKYVWCWRCAEWQRSFVEEKRKEAIRDYRCCRECLNAGAGWLRDMNRTEAPVSPSPSPTPAAAPPPPWQQQQQQQQQQLVRHAETELPLTHAAFREGREKTRAAEPERKRVLEKQSREKRQKANKQATQLNWNQYELESVRTGISMTGTSMNWNQYELEPV